MLLIQQKCFSKTQDLANYLGQKSAYFALFSIFGVILSLTIGVIFEVAYKLPNVGEIFYPIMGVFAISMGFWLYVSIMNGEFARKINNYYSDTTEINGRLERLNKLLSITENNTTESIDWSGVEIPMNALDIEKIRERLNEQVDTNKADLAKYSVFPSAPWAYLFMEKMFRKLQLIY